jgi:hypothetical protein
MFLSNTEIIAIAMVLATIIMIILHFIKIVWYKHLYNKGVKRVRYVKQLVDNDDIELVIINTDYEPQRIKQPDDDNGLIVDGVLYNDKTSYFLKKDGRIYIVGKKEDYVVALMGRFSNE